MSFLTANLASQTILMTGVLASQGFDPLLQAGLGISEAIEAPAGTESHLSGPVTQQTLQFYRDQYAVIANQLRDEYKTDANSNGTLIWTGDEPLTAYSALRKRLDALRPREEQPLLVQQAMIPTELNAALAIISLQTMLGEFILEIDGVKVASQLADSESIEQIKREARMDGYAQALQQQLNAVITVHEESPALSNDYNKQHLVYMAIDITATGERLSLPLQIKLIREVIHTTYHVLGEEAEATLDAIAGILEGLELEGPFRDARRQLNPESSQTEEG